MCIYYTDRKELTYETEDHIILSGLGGNKTLPKGYVSDQFNNKASSLEESFLRDSFIAVIRSIEGPGKQGKLGDKYQTKSKINVFKNHSDQNPFSLGYIKKGDSYLIPHFIYNSNLNKVISIAPANENDLKTINEFIEKCKKIGSLSIRRIYDENINEDLILFGIESGIEENYDGFIAQNKNNLNILDIELIKQVTSSLSLKENLLESKTPYTPSVSVKFSEDHFRIFAKMAFNCLADIKGVDFVKNHRFDRIRKWIINGGTNEFVCLNMNNYSPFAELGISFVNAEHFIWILTVEETLIAYINLYGKPITIIKLCENFTELISDGLVCNWREHSEHSIREYIKKI